MPDEEKVQRKRLVDLTLFFRVRLIVSLLILQLQTLNCRDMSAYSQLRGLNISFFYRRKLDFIITKLHQATPLESENVGEEENAVKCLFCHCLLCVNYVALYVSQLRSCILATNL